MMRSQSSLHDPFLHPTLDAWALSYLSARGISPDTAKVARLASMDARQVAEALDLKKEEASSGGLGIPYFDEKNSFLGWRIRLKEGELRYLVKKGESPRPYFPPTLKSSRYQSQEPLYVVEAPPKALSLAELGVLTLGLAGVEAGGVAKGSGALRLHSEILQRCLLVGRAVCLVFDAGVQQNPLVAFAHAKLAEAFRKAGALVSYVLLPFGSAGEDLGPDDAKVRLGEDKLRALLSASLSADLLVRLRALLSEDSITARSDRVRAFFEELPIQAALYVGKEPLRSQLAAEAKAKKASELISKKALDEVARDFKARLTEKLQSQERDNPQDDRPEIELSPDIHLVVAAALQVLCSSEVIFQRSRRLVTVARDAKNPEGIEREPGTPVLHTADRAFLRLLLSDRARFVESVGRNKGRVRSVSPPAWVAESIESLPMWENIRPLTAILEAPVFLRDGSLLEQPGYDHSTGLLYAPNANYPKVKETPSTQDIQEAKATIEEPFADFLFESEAHKAATLAALLTPLCRWSFGGNIPLFLIDANVPRGGKSLLADVIGKIVCGRAMPRMRCTEDDAEMGKRLMALALAGDPCAIIDNIPQDMALGTGILDAALTARGAGLQDRALGSNERMIRAPWDVCLYATGNNVAIKEDTIARVCQIRLFIPLEKPEERTGFRHPDLLEWVKEQRGRIVSAALTLARAWHLAGRPQHKGARWGGFDSWGDVVRSLLVFHGYADPGLTRRFLTEGKTSPERELHAALLDGWEEVSLGGLLTVSAALAKVRANDDEHALSKGALPQRFPRVREAFGLMGIPVGSLPIPRRLGRALEMHRKKVLSGRFLESFFDTHTKTLLWRVKSISALD